ncbi:MAG: sugar ABC transporter ATP-binding protein, partial [Actinobacteria bacterium]|nr:sugar ABC transporter ATP-binding protein [Actinomycetota bacterium]
MDYNISINRNIIEIINLSKSFPGVLALDNVTFNIKETEIHSIVGENGAGKSTLTKIIIGLLNKDSGRIIYNSKEINYKNIHESLQDKISCVFQEFSLCQNLTVAENIFLGRSFNKFYNKLGLTIKDRKGKECEKHLKNIGIERLNVNEVVGNLYVADKQLVEIAKSLVTKPRLLILDEPTSALSDNEAENLFKLIRNFKKNGMTIILISHIIEDVVKISDSITVLRDGKHIITRLKKELTKDEIVRFMIGRKITKETLNEIKTEETIFKVNNLCTKKLKNISMTLKKGEILGVMGLQGSGSSEFLRSVYGIQLKSGEIILNGQKIKVRNPLEASQNGIIYIPADRKKEGLIESLNIGNNLSFMKLRNYN